MRHILIACDYLGFQPTLHIDEKPRYKSVFTGILTIIVGIIAFLCIGYFGSELIIKSSPISLVTQVINSSFGPMNISNTGMNVMFALENQDFSYYLDETVYTIEATLTTTTSVLNSKTGNVETTSVIKPIKMDLCSKFYTNDDILEKNVVFPLNLYYCPEPNTAQIQGFWGSDQQQVFRVDFLKCQNTTSNKNHCKSHEEIDKTIQNKYVTYQMTSYFVDDKNVTNPMTRVFADDFNVLNAYSSMEYDIFFSSIEYQSDNGLLFIDKTILNGFSYDKKIFYRNIESEYIVSFTFEGSSGGKTYYRYYTKIQTVITQIGGFINFVYLIAAFISKIYSTNFYYIFLISNLKDKTTPQVESVSEINIVKAEKLRRDVEINLNDEQKEKESKSRLVRLPMRRMSIITDKQVEESQEVMNKISRGKIKTFFNYLCHKYLCRKYDNNSKLIDASKRLFTKVISVDEFMRVSINFEAFSKKFYAKMDKDVKEANYDKMLKDKLFSLVV